MNSFCEFFRPHLACFSLPFLHAPSCSQEEMGGGKTVGSQSMCWAVCWCTAWVLALCWRESMPAFHWEVRREVPKQNLTGGICQYSIWKMVVFPEGEGLGISSVHSLAAGKEMGFTIRATDHPNSNPVSIWSRTQTSYKSILWFGFFIYTVGMTSSPSQE